MKENSVAVRQRVKKASGDVTVRRHIKKKPGDIIFDVVVYVIVGLIAITALYPFLHVLSISMSVNEEAFRAGFHFFPKPGKITLEPYTSLLKASSVWLGYRNSIIVTVGGTVASLVVYTLLAYPLSKKKLPFRGFFTFLLIFTMLFNGGIVPTYIAMKELNLLNTFTVLMAQGIVSAFNILIVRNFFASIPEELEEAATIDGAGHFKTFVQIYLPLSKPVLTTIALWVGVYHWNSWFAATMYVQDPQKTVLQVVLRQTLLLMSGDSVSNFFKQAQAGDLGQIQMKNALIMISLIPILLVYPFVYKYFEKGIMVGAVKG